jgi:hypothetical protein
MTPEPGIYEDVAFGDYLSWEAVSNSKLSLLAKSPRHYQLGYAKEPTPAMRLGSLYHCGVLEPLMFADRYAICPDFHLDAENCTQGGATSRATTTKYVKDRMDEFRALCDGREIVPREWYDETIALVRELNENELARKLLNDTGPREVSIVWEEDGVLCKARIDKLAFTLRTIVDLKSTAAVNEFTKAIGRYGYHRQMAHYQAGWKELTGDTLHTALIAVESSAPHAVQAAPLSDEAMIAGREERQRLMDLLRVCMDTGNWPGMPNPEFWNVPEWALNQEPIELILNGQSIEV